MTETGLYLLLGGIIVAFIVLNIAMYFRNKDNDGML